MTIPSRARVGSTASAEIRPYLPPYVSEITQSSGTGSPTSGRRQARWDLAQVKTIPNAGILVFYNHKDLTSGPISRQPGSRLYLQLVRQGITPHNVVESKSRPTLGAMQHLAPHSASLYGGAVKRL